MPGGISGVGHLGRAPTASPPVRTTASVRFGIDRLLDREPTALWTRVQQAHRIGLVTNEAARLASDASRRTRTALQDAGVPLVRLFGPEHGLGAVAADGAAVADGMDTATGLPVVSLYGARMRPTRTQLADLDLVLFDIPDIGARFYTYTWTLYHLMAACAEVGVPLLVLDRPNPLGGILAAVEGPLLEPSCRSFVGEDRIPIRHALTLGELARLWQREQFPAVDLTVLPCTGWSRAVAWPGTGLPWVPTSPAMPAYASAVWYTGLCLFEATNVSVGRGTPWPFEVVGAPWFDADGVVEALHTLNLPGLAVEAVQFTPTMAPWKECACRGIRLRQHPAPHEITTESETADGIRPVRTGLHLLQTVIRLHPDAFSWAPYVTAANPTGADHFARLVGRPDLGGRLREAAPDEIARWTHAPGWDQRVAPILLYDETESCATR